MKSDIPKKEPKRAKIQKSYDSDDNVDTREAELHNYVDKCQQQAWIYLSFLPVEYDSQFAPNVG